MLVFVPSNLLIQSFSNAGVLLQLLIPLVEGFGRCVGAIDVTLYYRVEDPVRQGANVRPLGAIGLLFHGIDVPSDLEVPGFICV